MTVTDSLPMLLQIEKNLYNFEELLMAEMLHPMASGARPPGPNTHAQNPTDRKSVEIHAAAQKLEATFLAEMLKSAGFGQQRESLGGGVGEEQFSSFLVQAQAEAMVRAGGVGLTETFVKALMEAQND